MAGCDRGETPGRGRGRPGLQTKSIMTIDWRPFTKLVSEAQSFVVTSHMRPDCDAIGSELGFALALRSLGKQVRIVNGDAEGLLDAVVTAPPDLPDIGAAHAEALGTGRTSQALLLTTLVRLASTAEVDADADGVPDVCDNCPSSQNTPQVDTNTNGIGDACEPVETEADRVFDWAEFVHPTLFPTPSIRGV